MQGVGFRPFVYQLALANQLNGWVLNGNDGVHIEINASEDIAQGFLKQLLASAPPLCKIQHYSLAKVNDQSYQDFAIIESTANGHAGMMITPDYALCENCRAEMLDPKNRRYRYPFITCTHCGPRYSIIQQLPYDRPNTGMVGFNQCKSCAAEYNDPLNRRHYSQTNSCAICGIELLVWEDGIWQT
ncbi:MAG: hypothetical protein RLY16_1730, partial [Bacteroidota bacterium]